MSKKPNNLESLTSWKLPYARRVLAQPQMYAECHRIEARRIMRAEEERLAADRARVAPILDQREGKL